MAHSAENNHQSHAGLIWKVFGILTLITIVEVLLGITKPDSLYLGVFLGTSPLNWIFIILTLAKAYGITWYFMHMIDEKTSFRRSVVWSTVFLIIFLLLILITEASYVHKVIQVYINWEY